MLSTERRLTGFIRTHSRDILVNINLIQAELKAKYELPSPVLLTRHKISKLQRDLVVSFVPQLNPDRVITYAHIAKNFTLCEC